jgi:hypothetical protein
MTFARWAIVYRITMTSRLHGRVEATTVTRLHLYLLTRCQLEMSLGEVVISFWKIFKTCIYIDTVVCHVVMSTWISVLDLCWSHNWHLNLNLNLLLPVPKSELYTYTYYETIGSNSCMHMYSWKHMTALDYYNTAQ